MITRILLIVAGITFLSGCSLFNDDASRAKRDETKMQPGGAKFGGSGSITKGGGTVGQ